MTWEAPEWAVPLINKADSLRDALQGSAAQSLTRVTDITESIAVRVSASSESHSAIGGDWMGFRKADTLDGRRRKLPTDRSVWTIVSSIETRERLRRQSLAKIAIDVERRRLQAEELVVKEVEVRERERSKQTALQLEAEER